MDILMCEYMDTDTVFQVGSHYYAKHFYYDGYSINWVNNPHSYLYSRKHSRVLNDRFKVYYPKVFLPFCKLPILNTKFWAKNYTRYLTKAISDQINIKDTDILWMTNVKMFELSNQVNYKLMIHRMADDFSGFTGAYKNMIYLQNEVIKKSDLVVVSAKNLLDKAYKYNKNVFYLPNGVDLDRFNKNNFTEPSEYKNINMPKVVYVGAMEDWFDYKLILDAADKLVDVAFIMIGNINVKAKKLFSNYRNIFLLGKKPHEEIPNYLNYANVGIMPFIDNRLTNSIHPLKLYEYFAAGLPVIARDLNEVREMKSPAILYKNTEEFIFLIREILNQRTDPEYYKEYASKNTWENRYKQLKEYISITQGDKLENFINK